MTFALVIHGLIAFSWIEHSLATVCTCIGGTAAIGTACPANYVNSCAVCFVSFHLVGDSCDANVCVCAGGSPASGFDCTGNGANMCSSCYAGYHRMGDNCLANVCMCSGGTPAAGADCTANGANMCSSCDAGCHRARGNCLANICSCENGVPSTGTNCTAHGTISCSSCDTGYRRTEESCLVDIRKFPQVIAQAAGVVAIGVSLVAGLASAQSMSSAVGEHREAGAVHGTGMVGHGIDVAGGAADAMKAKFARALTIEGEWYVKETLEARNHEWQVAASTPMLTIENDLRCRLVAIVLDFCVGLLIQAPSVQRIVQVRVGFPAYKCCCVTIPYGTWECCRLCSRVSSGLGADGSPMNLIKSEVGADEEVQIWKQKPFELQGVSSHAAVMLRTGKHAAVLFAGDKMYKLRRRPGVMINIIRVFSPLLFVACALMSLYLHAPVMAYANMALAVLQVVAPTAWFAKFCTRRCNGLADTCSALSPLLTSGLMLAVAGTNALLARESDPSMGWLRVCLPQHRLILGALILPLTHRLQAWSESASSRALLMDDARRSQLALLGVLCAAAISASLCALLLLTHAALLERSFTTLCACCSGWAATLQMISSALERRLQDVDLMPKAKIALQREKDQRADVEGYRRDRSAVIVEANDGRQVGAGPGVEYNISAVSNLAQPLLR